MLTFIILFTIIKSEMGMRVTKDEWYRNVNKKDIPKFAVIEYFSGKEGEITLMSKFMNETKLFHDSGIIGKINGAKIVVFGAPLSYRQESLLMLLCNSQVKVVYAIGVAGSINLDIKRGDILIPTEAIRGDGLTSYYAPKNIPAVSNSLVLNSLLNSSRKLKIKTKSGIIYTTESVFKEPEFMNEWKKLNAVAVEQNLSKHFLLCHLYGKMPGGVYGISDMPISGNRVWVDGIKKDKIYHDTVNNCAKIIVESIKDLNSQI